MGEPAASVVAEQQVTRRGIGDALVDLHGLGGVRNVMNLNSVEPAIRRKPVPRYCQ